MPETPPPLSEFEEPNFGIFHTRDGQQVRVWGDITLHGEASTLPGDFDGDGFPNQTDNCPATVQVNQADAEMRDAAVAHHGGGAGRIRG